MGLPPHVGIPAIPKLASHLWHPPRTGWTVRCDTPNTGTKHVPVSPPQGPSYGTIPIAKSDGERKLVSLSWKTDEVLSKSNQAARGRASSALGETADAAQPFSIAGGDGLSPGSHFHSSLSKYRFNRDSTCAKSGAVYPGPRLGRNIPS